MDKPLRLQIVRLPHKKTSGGDFLKELEKHIGATAEWIKNAYVFNEYKAASLEFIKYLRGLQIMGQTSIRASEARALELELITILETQTQLMKAQMDFRLDCQGRMQALQELERKRKE